MAAFDQTAQKMIVLEKVQDLSGDLPLGSIFRWTYKTPMNEFTVRDRANRALKATHPNENVLGWKVVQYE